MGDAGFPAQTVQWLVQQGVLGVVLVLVIWDYRRTMQRVSKDLTDRDDRMIRKLEEDKGVLLTVVKDNTRSNVELTSIVSRWVRVTEESFPRREHDRKAWEGTRTRQGDHDDR